MVCGPHTLWGADHDRLAVLDEGLVALEPIGPGAIEPLDTERVGSIKFLLIEHHLLDGTAELPRLIVRVE